MKINLIILALCGMQSGTCAAFTHLPLTKTFKIKASSDLASMSSGDAVKEGATTQVSSAGAGPIQINEPPQTLAKSAFSEVKKAKDIWKGLKPIIVQGLSLRTWSLADPSVDRVQVFMKTDGRPLNANIELWEGPDNTPQKMSVYIEDGDLRPFNAVIETPRDTNAVAIYNTGYLEFPLSACVEVGSEELAGESADLYDLGPKPKIIQGGAIHTIPFAPVVQSVKIILKTDGRPLNARIELLQGPNNNKQVMEVHTEDGALRPFVAIIEAPGAGNVVRIVNTATVEFPLYAGVTPHLVEPGREDLMYEGTQDWDKAGRSPFRW